MISISSTSSIVSRDKTTFWNSWFLIAAIPSEINSWNSEATLVLFSNDFGSNSRTSKSFLKILVSECWVGIIIFWRLSKEQKTIPFSEKSLTKYKLSFLWKTPIKSSSLGFL